MNEIKVFEYNGTPITFQTGENKYVNATEMAKPFGKQASDWLRQKSTETFVRELSSVRGIPLTGLVKVFQGGMSQGTWMHEDVALEFARWLSPKFAIWCNDRIKELMKFGVTATEVTIDRMLADPEFGIKMFTALKEERERSRLLAEHNNKQAKLIEEQQPAVNFTKAVSNSDTLILIHDMAKILKQHGYNTGGLRLFEQLRKDGYLTMQNAPTQRSMELGIMRVVENTVTTPVSTKIVKTTKITGKGQVYFLNKYCKMSVTEAQNVINWSNENMD